jgi:hypothetical protein
MLVNGSELRGQVKSLITSSSQEVMIISAFMKSSIIEELSELFEERSVVIYVRWKLIDILRGVSDFESLYEICFKNGYKLYFNQRLHAKAIILDKNRAIIGSSNFTQSGLGLGNVNIEWNKCIDNLTVDEYQRIVSSLSGSDLVTPLIVSNFRKALDSINLPIDFNEFEMPRIELFNSPATHYSDCQKELPPFEQSTLNFEILSHREYLQSLGFISLPSEDVLIKAIENSYYGQLVLNKLQSQPLRRNGEKRLRWGDFGYADLEFFSKNDGLHNLFLWLSKIDDNYHFYRNSQYPKGTCSLNYLET